MYNMDMFLCIRFRCQLYPQFFMPHMAWKRIPSEQILFHDAVPIPQSDHVHSVTALRGHDVYNEIGGGGYTNADVVTSKGGCVDLVLWIWPECRQEAEPGKIAPSLI